jgi:hypothetical protein
VLSVLAGRRVLLWRDHDTPGVRHMREIARDLSDGIAAAVRWIDWKQAPPSGDAADFINQRGASALRDLLSEALIEEPPFTAPVGETHEPRYARANENLNTKTLPATFTETPPPVEVWPEPLDSAAFNGPLGAIVQEVAEESEADPAGVLLSLLPGWGNLIGPSPAVAIGNTRHRLVLFVCIVGDSSEGRKGTAWSIARHVLDLLDERWVRTCVKSGIVSGEGIIDQVRDPTEEEIHDAEKAGKEVARNDRRLLLVETEFARTLRIMERAGNNTEAILRLAWDGDPLSSMARHSPLCATDAHVSLLAHITPEELAAYFTDLSAANGFGNRFLWVLVRRPREVALPPPLRLDRIGRELDALRRALGPARRTTWLGYAAPAPPGIPLDEFDQAARALWCERYPALTKKVPGFLGAITQRRAPYVRRLAAIYALAADATVVSLDHLRAALAVWDYCARSAEVLFEKRLGHRTAADILSIVRVEQRLTRAALYDALGRNVRRSDIDEAVDVLRRQAMIRLYEDRTTKRPRQVLEITDRGRGGAWSD